MQAQASGQAGASGAGGLQGALQNPKVQIGVIVAGAIAIILVIYFVFFGDSAPPAPVAPSGPSGTPFAGGAAGNGPSAANLPSAAPPSAGATATPAGMPAPAGAPGAPAAAGAKPGSPAADKDAKKAPGVPTRANPFAETEELKKVEDSIPEIKLPEAIAPDHTIYADELHKPKELVSVNTSDVQPGEPAIPAMRLAGVVYGDKVSATLQIGEVFLQAVPGAMVPAQNPVYHVDRIEQDRMFLSRRWEQGGHKGVQHIEVTLQGAPQRPAGMMPGGFPGAAGGNGPGGNGPGGNRPF